ncbi:MAG: hypothetical protein ACRYGP_17515 [Janthinobacterium lividum]
MNQPLTLDEKIAMREQLDRETRTEASRTVAFLLRLFNAHEPLPATVNHKGTTVPTGRFLRGISLDPVTRELPASHLYQRGLGENANGLSAQAFDLADAAEREGLLDKPNDASADTVSAETRNLLERGNNVPTVTVEALQLDPATAAFNAERDAGDTAVAEADRRRLAEVHAIRADKARGGMFDRSAFRDQTAS